MEARISDVINELFAKRAAVLLTRPAAEFGDYATNVALQLARPLGKSPREIAEQIASKLRESGEFAEVSVAGPGFINVKLSDRALINAATKTPERTLKGKRVLVEYSDPNPFKPLHAGHLYTTLVGDTIARLVENAGAETVRINYGGDVGRHVATSMWAICRELGGENPDKLHDIPEADRPEWLGHCYSAGYAAFEEDDRAKEEILAFNKRVYAIHTENDHESPFAKIYWTCRQWSYDYFASL